MGRISKDMYYIGIAKAVSKRSTCIRRQYGAVIVKNDRIVSTGYNGSMRGAKHCCDTGVCEREVLGIPHGQQYERCLAVHAEQNAIIQANPLDLAGATLYLYGSEGDSDIVSPQPCDMCTRFIKNAGIAKVVKIGGKNGRN